MHPIVFSVGPLDEDDDFPASFDGGEQCVSTPYEVFINIHDDTQDKMYDGFVSELNSNYTQQPQYINGNSPEITKHVAHLEGIMILKELNPLHQQKVQSAREVKFQQYTILWHQAGKQVQSV